MTMAKLPKEMNGIMNGHSEKCYLTGNYIYSIIKIENCE